MATDASNHANVPTSADEPKAIPLYDRLVLWMFMVGIGLFAVLLLADLFAGVFQ